jgi:predicted O-methyltransferase YrrM
MDSYKLAEISVFRGACQKMRELTPLVSLLKRRKLHTVIEIGTMKGGTLWLWCQLAMPDAIVISVADGEFGGGYKAKDIKRFRAYAQAEQSLQLIRKDSHQRETRNEVAKKLNGRAVDLLFIDGDHRYRGVQKDFEMYAPFVRNGGIVLFHDILPHPKVPVCGVDSSGMRSRRTSSTESSLKKTMIVDGDSGEALECCLTRKRHITKHCSGRPRAGAAEL